MHFIQHQLNIHQIIRFYKNFLQIYHALQSIINNMLTQAISSLILTVDPEETISHEPSFDQLIQKLEQAQMNKPKMFANNFHNLIQIINQYSHEVSLLDRSSLLDTGVAAIEGYPSVFRKNKQKYMQLFDAIFATMTMINYQVPPNWIQPPEGFDFDDVKKMEEEDPDSAIITKCLAQVDKLANIIGYEIFYDLISGKLLNLFMNEDWRFKSAVLLAASQLSQNISDLGKLQIVNNLIQKGSIHDHPKVRYAAAHALGQISDDLKPQYQQRYFQQMFPILHNSLDDKVERVSSHWFACLTNFIEDFQDTPKVEPYVDSIIEKIQSKIQKGSSHIKENAISALASIGSIPYYFNSSSIKRPLELISVVISTYSADTVYKQLINQTVECLTLFFYNQSMESYLPFIIETLNELGFSMDKTYFFSAWNRVCLRGKQFDGWENVYLKVMNQLESSTPQESVEAVKSILQTIELFKEKFMPYVGPCFEKLTNIMNTTEDNNLLMQIIKTRTAILSKAKGANPDPAFNVEINKCLALYVTKAKEFIEDEEKFEIVQILFKEIANLLEENFGSFENGKLFELFQFLHAFIEDIDLKGQELQEDFQGIKMEDEVDVEGFETLNKESMEQLSDIKLVIPDIIRQILKHLKNQEMESQIIQQCVKMAFKILQKPTSSPQDLRYAIYYLDDIIDDFQYSRIQPFFQNIFQQLHKFSTHADSKVRNAAIWGYGVAISKIPKSAVKKEDMDKIIDVAKIAYSINQGKEKKKVYQHCRDNCVVVLGKVLREFSHIYQLDHIVDTWFSLLPLRQDKEEGRIQVQILMGLMNTNPEKLVTSTNRLTAILRIYGEFLEIALKKKADHQDLINQLQTHMTKLKEWTVFQQNAQSMKQNLSSKVIQRLQQLVDGKYL